MSKSTLISLFSVFFFWSKSVEGGETIGEEMIAKFQKYMRVLKTEEQDWQKPQNQQNWKVKTDMIRFEQMYNSYRKISLAFVCTTTDSGPFFVVVLSFCHKYWFIDWRQLDAIQCKWVVVKQFLGRGYTRNSAAEFKVILDGIAIAPQIVRDQFYGKDEPNHGMRKRREANKEKENKFIAKFQELMWAVKQDKKTRGSGGGKEVLAKLEDWTGWSNLYILALACEGRMPFIDGVEFSIQFHTAWRNDLSWVDQFYTCKWIVLNKGNQGDVRLYNLEEFKKIVDDIERRDFPQKVRELFYGRQDLDVSDGNDFPPQHSYGRQDHAKSSTLGEFTEIVDVIDGSEDFSQNKRIGIAISAVLVIGVVAVGFFVA